MGRKLTFRSGRDPASRCFRTTSEPHQDERNAAAAEKHGATIATLAGGRSWLGGSRSASLSGVSEGGVMGSIAPRRPRLRRRLRGAERLAARRVGADGSPSPVRRCILPGVRERRAHVHVAGEVAVASAGTVTAVPDPALRLARARAACLALLGRPLRWVWGARARAAALDTCVAVAVARALTARWGKRRVGARYVRSRHQDTAGTISDGRRRTRFRDS